MAEFLCTAGGNSFAQKVSLQKHFYANHKEDTFTCKECGKVLRTISNHLHSHEKISCIGCHKIIAKNSRASQDCGNFETFMCDQYLYDLV